eukprot:768634-Hanusia_phi.AAC.8
MSFLSLPPYPSHFTLIDHPMVSTFYCWEPPTENRYGTLQGYYPRPQRGTTPTLNPTEQTTTWYLGP